jgi:hypothetical protein
VDWPLPKPRMLGIPEHKRLLLLYKGWTSSKSNLMKIMSQTTGVKCSVDDNTPNLTQLIEENQLWQIKDNYKDAGGYGESRIRKKIAQRQRRTHQRARRTCGKTPQINGT